LRHSLYVFDAYGTLFDVHSAVARYRSEIGAQSERLSDIWRAKQLEYTWVRSLMGTYRNFETLTAEALDFAALNCGGLTGSLRQSLLDAYMRLDAYPDVEPTLVTLRQRGAKTAILSNGTAPMLEAACTFAKLRHLFDVILSVDQVKVFKTHRSVYDLVAAHFRCAAAEVSFQSSNRWDIAGAAHYGFYSVWINRREHQEEYSDLPPALVLPSLAKLLEA
jgi:2-haloacid dehalogenase